MGRIITILIIAGVFALYFLYLRPNVVKEVCDHEALKHSVFMYPRSDYPDMERRSGLQNDAYWEDYKDCLILNGVSF